MSESTGGQALEMSAIDRRMDGLAPTYAAAVPFPHVVIDDFLPAGVFAAACSEFPSADDETWTSYVHYNERKHGNMVADRWPQTIQTIARFLTSAEFTAAIERLTGCGELMSDWSMDGGGLHQSTTGGFLNVHADFTSHHKHENWRRRVNLLLYLNESWSPEWGGGLELWAHDMSACIKTVAPVGNRVVIFTTDEHSYHGHPEAMTCPVGAFRRSMALYYFTDEGRRALANHTDYRARPGDGVRSIAIYLDKQVLHAYDVVKRRLKLSDDFANRALRGMERIRHSRLRR